MNDLIVYKESDLDEIHKLLGAEDAKILKARAKAVAHFLRASDKDRAAEEIRAMLPELKGMSAKNLYKLASKFDPKRPLMSLADGRLLRRLEAGGLAANKEFIAFWHELCLNNKRKTAPAYRELFARLRAGEVIPGYGDWREIFAGENGGLYPAPDRACPYEANLHVPKGWTARTLNRLKPDEFALVAMRKGMMEATMEKTPDIRRTRAGLKSGRVIQFDDMWYEHKVISPLNKKPQRVVEYAMMDVATGCIFAYLPKPVLETMEGKLETLKSVWTRYCYAYLLGTIGVPKEGVIIMGEHGTASADNDLRVTLARISGGRIEFDGKREVVAEEGSVRFGAGGILTRPIEKGFYEGRGKGNPRYKGSLEGMHGYVKNELAGVLGHMGGGRDEHGEWVYGMEKHDDRLSAIVKVLESTRPGIGCRIVRPFMDYFDFRSIIDLAYNRINSRMDHRLEGWDEQGFMLPEYWNAAACAWVPVESVRNEPRVIQQAIYNAIQAGKIKVRKRRLSPVEAWELRAGDREWKLPPSVIALEVMGPRLCQTCLCTDKLQLHYKDLSTLTDCWVNGILDGGGSLTRGVSYQVWINPFEPLKAFIADMQGKYIGTAKVQEMFGYDDIEGVKRALAVRQTALAEERKRIQPALNRMLRKEAAIAAHNASAIFGEDPALKVAVGRAAAHEIERTDAADLDLEYTPDETQDDINPSEL